GIGYHMRTHMGKALKARSQAIRTALDKYNAAATKLVPPERTLNWDEVVQYAFLAEFDLLRDARQDIRDKPWSKPAARLLLDQYFKLERAREEIKRLNIEVRRLLTYMQDEENFLDVSIVVLKQTDLALANEVFIYQQERARANNNHRKRFERLAKLKGFTGNMEPGRS
ncbi:hypothetical protein BDN72DRAFT_730691, partial [Pluteus cervinus]